MIFLKILSNNLVKLLCYISCLISLIFISCDKNFGNSEKQTLEAQSKVNVHEVPFDSMKEVGSGKDVNLN